MQNLSEYQTPPSLPATANPQSNNFSVGGQYNALQIAGNEYYLKSTAKGIAIKTPVNLRDTSAVAGYVRSQAEPKSAGGIMFWQSIVIGAVVVAVAVVIFRIKRSSASDQTIKA